MTSSVKVKKPKSAKKTTSRKLSKSKPKKKQRESTSSQSRKPKKPSKGTPYSKKPDESFRAVFISSRTGKLLKKFPTGSKSQVKLGIAKGETFKAFDMEPQRATKSDLKALQRLLKQKEQRLNPKKIENLGTFLFFQTRTTKNQVDKNGKVIYRTEKVKGRERLILKDGKPIPKKVLKITTKAPRAKKNKASVWRELEFDGTKFLRLSSAPLQQRDKFEALTSDLLSQAEKLPFREEQAQIKASYLQNTIVLEGTTLKNALRKIRVPVSTKWLVENKIQSINVEMKISIRHNGELIKIPTMYIPVRYMTDLYEELGTNIRRQLAQHGLTFTRMRTFQEIKEELKRTRTRQQFAKEWHSITQVKTAPYQFTSILSQINGGPTILEELEKGSVTIQATFAFMKKGDFPKKLPKNVQFIEAETEFGEID